MLPALSAETIEPESLLWRFKAAADLPFFQGHFPGAPVLPGVVALGWMLAAAERFLGRPLGPLELANVKFQTVVLPDTELELRIARKPGNRLHATLCSAAGVHASALIPGQDG